MENNLTELRHLTRSRIGNIWQLAQRRVEQEGEAASTAEILKQHPEYYDIWDQADTLPPEILRDGGNPFAQIADLDPPQTAATLEALIQAEYDRHDAIHAIGALVANEIYEIMKNDRPFDQASYVKALDELAQTPKPRRRLERKRRKRKR